MPMVFISDILAQQPNDSNPLDWAKQTLHVFARMGESAPEQKQYYADYEDEQEAGAELLTAACVQVEPPCLKAYALKDNKLILEFNDTYEKPPIRMIWHQMDLLKEKLLQCFTKVSGSDCYYVEDTIDTPLDVLGFVQNFSDEAHHAYPYYKLPEGVTFTARDGRNFTNICGYHTMVEYLETHTYPGLAGNTIDNLDQAGLIIDKEQMQRIVDQLGLGLEQGKRPS